VLVEPGYHVSLVLLTISTTPLDRARLNLPELDASWRLVSLSWLQASLDQKGMLPMEMFLIDASPASGPAGNEPLLEAQGHQNDSVSTALYACCCCSSTQSACWSHQGRALIEPPAATF